MEKESIMNLRQLVLLFVIFITVIMNGFLMGLLRPPGVLTELRILSWISLGISIALVVMAVISLRRERANTFNKSGIYSVVRHPMYLSGIFFLFFMGLWGQHWIVAILTGEAIACIYMLMLLEDKQSIMKYKDAYAEYMHSVPRANPIAGILRIVRRRKKF